MIIIMMNVPKVICRYKDYKEVPIIIKEEEERVIHKLKSNKIPKQNKFEEKLRND